MQLFKRVLLSPLYVPAVAKGIGVLTHTSAAIFVLHRFGCCAEGVAGHDPAGVRSIVSQLRKEGYELISLREMFLRQREGKALRNTVAFTIDDGYFDQAEIEAPIFELHYY